MGLIKDISESLIKFIEIILSKTEIYTEIIKQHITIKKLENEAEKIKITMANILYKKIENGNKNLNLKDKEIIKFYDDIKHLKNDVHKIKKTLEKLKTSKIKKIEKKK